LRRAVLLLGLVVLLGAGFAAGGGASLVARTSDAAKCKKGYKRVHGKCVKVKKKKKKPTTTTGRTTTTTTTTTAPPPKGGFATGVYFIAPSTTDPNAGTIKLLGGSLPAIPVTGHSGFDVGRVLVWVYNSEVHVVQPSGASRVLYIQGLNALSHPSLAPDGTKVVVQATQTDDPDATYQTSYVIDLSSGNWTLFAPTGALPYDGSDFPTWSPAGDVIAYETTEINSAGLECTAFNIADASTGAVKGTIRRANDAGCERAASLFWEAPRTNLAFSADGKKLLLVGLLSVVDPANGSELANIKDKVLAGVQAAGYQPDDRYPGRAGATPVALAGGFSPDGTKIAFDGSVRKGDDYYQLVMRINLDGSGFTILDGPFLENPRFAAGVTYSVLSTAWNS
jgi:hypothetical protein